MGDRIVAGAISSELRKFGWQFSTKSVPAAYLTGYLAGLRAKKAEIENAVLDSGLLKPTKGGRIYAAMKGLIDAGIDIPHGEETEPDEERLKGKHLNDEIEKVVDQIKEKMVV